MSKWFTLSGWLLAAFFFALSCAVEWQRMQPLSPLFAAGILGAVLSLIPAAVILYIGLTEQRRAGDDRKRWSRYPAWCSRAHSDGPCNGWPRPNCPGFDAFCREHPGYAEHCLDHTLSSTQRTQ